MLTLFPFQGLWIYLKYVLQLFLCHLIWPQLTCHHHRETLTDHSMRANHSHHKALYISFPCLISKKEMPSFLLVYFVHCLGNGLLTGGLPPWTSQCLDSPSGSIEVQIQLCFLINYPSCRCQGVSNRSGIKWSMHSISGSRGQQELVGIMDKP